MKRPVHVAVIGGSGSGKTWLAEKLAARLKPRAARLSLDDFYRDLAALPMRERDRVNFDDPAAIDWEKFRTLISTMRVGETIDLPAYDFATHTRKSETHRFVPPPLVIWDGLWLRHHDWLQANFSLTCFVACDADERLRRRIERDTRERGRTPGSVQQQFFNQVQPMHEKFVEPQRQQADIVLTSPLGADTVEKLIHKMLDSLP